MNYGYDCEGWSKEQKEELALELAKLCLAYIDEYDIHPYVQIDCLYDGVRIRRITHLNGKDRELIVKQADKIYLKILGKRK